MTWFRNCAAVVAAALVAVIFASPGTAVTGETGVDRFGGCLAAQKSGQLLLMIDESGSLKDTDPQDNRVTAAKYLAQQLTQFSADAGIALDVALAGFSEDYRQVLGWTRLNAANLPAVESGIDGFKDRDNGQDTDYWTALDGARSTFGEAPKPAEGKQCQALAWFTDGKLDFNQRDASKPYAPGQNLSSQAGIDATIKAAQDSICRDRGLADQLRSSGIVTFGIGLAPKPEQSADFDVLKAIVTGQPTGAVLSCGAIRSPTPGDFYLAQNIDDLLFAFDKFSTPGQPPTEITSGACAREICEEAKHRFVLDRSVRSVSVLAAADKTGLTPYLVAPDGASVALNAGPATLDLGGVKVDYLPEGEKSVSIRMSNSQAPQWQGVWALVFVDPAGDATAKTRSSIHISGDLYPAWPVAANTTLHSGDNNVSVALAVVDGRKEPVDPSTLLGSASMSAVLVDVKGGEHPVATDLPKDQIRSPQVLDLANVPPGAATLQLVLNVTTAEAHQPNGAIVPGTQLAAQRVDLPIKIDPPVGYPKVADRIDFGALEGQGSFHAMLAVTGPGCAWLVRDATTVAAEPDGVGVVSVGSSANSANNCVKPAENQQQSLPVELKIPSAGTGAVNGTVKVLVAPADGTAEPIAVEVPFTASLHKPLNTANFILALVVALILGPGVPLLLLYLSKWLVSRIPAKALRAQQIPVRLSGTSVLRDSSPFTVRDGELVNLVQGLDKPARRLDLDGITLRTRIGLSPFGAGFAVASAPGRAGAAGKSAATHGKTPDAKLPLAVHNTWFVLHDPAGPHEVATVVLLVSGDAGAAVVDRLITEVTSSLPRVLADLRARANPIGTQPGSPTSPQTAGDNPFAATTSPTTGTNPFGPGARSGNPGPATVPGGNPFGAGGVGSGNPFSPGGPTTGSGNPFGSSGPPPSQPSGGNPMNPFR
ncbi:vWA domain-containing protein [Mycobacterium sp. NPDC048908]|uniref:vWA domain-containing protein n=1 Tax=Mycobacterium sp. NPDC048908 TaxID=3364292 RepID=UPI0037226297